MRPLRIHLHTLGGESRALATRIARSTLIAPEAAVGADHPVARHGVGVAVVRHRRADRPCRTRHAGCPCDVAIGGDSPPGHLTHQPIDRLPERAAVLLAARLPGPWQNRRAPPAGLLSRMALLFTERCRRDRSRLLGVVPAGGRADKCRRSGRAGGLPLREARCGEKLPSRRDGGGAGRWAPALAVSAR
ncbi:MAG: hypothetical protein KatS3mg102_0156 [Planctomycetota bacterium]|nr:MAG: hypothetical protein KatS3mg102_0156 [Planctomycetota bacterium]